MTTRGATRPSPTPCPIRSQLTCTSTPVLAGFTSTTPSHRSETQTALLYSLNTFSGSSRHSSAVWNSTQHANTRTREHTNTRVINSYVDQFSCCSLDKKKPLYINIHGGSLSLLRLVCVWAYRSAAWTTCSSDLLLRSDKDPLSFNQTLITRFTPAAFSQTGRIVL